MPQLTKRSPTADAIMPDFFPAFWRQLDTQSERENNTLFFFLADKRLADMIYCIILHSMRNDIDELINRVKSDDKEAFRQLFETYYPPLWRFVYSKIRNTENARDLMQILFLKVWQQRGKLRSGTSFYAYLATIASHLIWDLLRHQKIVSHHAEAAIQSQAPLSPEEETSYHLLQEQIISIIHQFLPEKCRLVFTLSRLEGWDNQSIADELKITKKTVENQLVHALKVIRQKIKR